MVLNTEWAQVEVIDLINDGSGLAFGIIGGRSTGVVVKTILPGGVADRDGRLQSGDHILQIGDVNIRGLGSEQVAAVLRQCGIHVRMVVARPVEPTANDYQSLGSHAPIVPTKLLGDLDELDRHLVENGYAETFCHTPPDPYSAEFIYTRQHSDIELHSGIVDVVRDPLPIGAAPTVPSPSTPIVEVELLPLDMALKGSPPPETEIYRIQLKKDELGLGITVAGYVCEKEEISGIFVKSISAGSAADFSKKIRINDRIIEVDGIPVVGFTNHQAVQQLRHTSCVVQLTFERYLRGPKYEQLQQAIRANELKAAVTSPPLSPSLSSLPKIPISLLDTSYHIEPEGESRTSFDIDSSVLLDPPTPVNEVEIVIDEKCSMLHRQDSYNSIKEKWKDIIGPDILVVVAELIKDLNGGLGISLEGTVDVEDGREVRPHHYIRSVLPDGPVGRNGLLQSGDELLEVNNIRLLGLNHVEVVSILRQLPQNVCLICARYGPDSSQRRIIDTAQDRNAFAARNILAGSLQNLIPLSESGLVKAKSESSLATVSTGGGNSQASDNSRSKSRSLELQVGLAMWKDEPEAIELIKGEKGLGFSILDYQDPLNPKDTVIVVRSLVPGGVAHSNGRLIPGDRLLFVNETSLVGATLDKAVQVLKGAPKGPVRIGVAKPLSTHDTLSQSSQMSSLSFQECLSDQDDQTCLEDYHECIEEYQECLEVMHICFDDGKSSIACSPCTSYDDVHSSIASNSKDNQISSPTPAPETTTTSSTPEINSNVDCVKKITSLVDSIYDRQFSKLSSDTKQVRLLHNNNNNEASFSPKDDSDRDGYDTCQEEPSLKISYVKPVSISSSQKSLTDEHNLLDNSKNLTVNFNVDNYTSEPCIRKKMFSKRNHVCLDTKPDDIELKSYDDQNNSFGADQFFLVDYIDDDISEEIQEMPDKWISEPNVTEERTISRRFRKFLREYYNDYADCLDEYRKFADVPQSEVTVAPVQVTENVTKSTDTLVNVENTISANYNCDFECMEFENVFIPIKSSSSPALVDSLTKADEEEKKYCDKNRRKSAFVPGYSNDSDALSMTVTRNLEAPGCHTVAEDTAAMLEKHWGSTHTVQVHRDSNQSLGISIVGGKVDLYKSGSTSETLLGIFVKSVVPNSPAGRTGQFKTGDRILEVDGIDLRHAPHEIAVEAIRSANNPVTFLVQSLIPWANGNENELPSLGSQLHKEPVSPYPSVVSLNQQEPVVPNSFKPPTSPQENDVPCVDSEIAKIETKKSVSVKSENEKRVTIVEDVSKIEKETEEVKEEEAETTPEPDMDQIPEEESEESSDEGDFRELEGKTHSSKGKEIDRASAANVKRTKEEIEADPDVEDDFGYTNNKVKKKYAALGQVLMVQLERGQQGLGISLAGHRDRSCMAVFVCGLNPKGAAHRNGAIHVGDEILEVNGIVLHGRCHLNASAIIKGLSGPIFKVIILRRKTALEDIAVRPITQFPVTLAEETPEERYASYPNVRTVNIKKGMHSLGIMIIEGRHAEVGQGIFISDIQEGSAAEKAGLDIGEMILAVNSDSLLGASYDSAASLLKRTEGLVSLVVSNPNKRVPSPAPAVEITTARGVTLNDATKNDLSTPHRPTSALKTSAPPSRPTTPTAGECLDPTTCPIIPGRETNIEISTDNKNFGVAFVGGKDSLISGGIVILEIYPDGAAKRDGRLQPGDQLIEVNGTSLLDVTQTNASAAIRQILPKFRITVFRPENINMTSVEVDLVKKPGKGLGLSLLAKKDGEGLYISEILNSSNADIDGRLMRGDLITNINDQQVATMTSEQVATILKTAVGKVTIKLQRHKPLIR